MSAIPALAVGIWGVLGLGVMVILGLLIAEIGPTATWLAPRVAKRAAKRLPSPYREIREEEWLRLIADMDAGMKITRLLCSLGFHVASFRLLRNPTIRAAAQRERQEAAAAQALQSPTFTQKLMVYMGLIEDKWDPYSGPAKGVPDDAGLGVLIDQLHPDGYVEDDAPGGE